MWPAFLCGMRADGAEHIRAGLDGEVETPETRACQMPRASTYFLARSEGWRGLLKKRELLFERLLDGRRSAGEVAVEAPSSSSLHGGARPSPQRVPRGPPHAPTGRACC